MLMCQHIGRKKDARPPGGRAGGHGSGHGLVELDEAAVEAVALFAAERGQDLGLPALRQREHLGVQGHALVGERTGRRWPLGMRVQVELKEATPITGGLLFELLEVEGRKMPTPPRRTAKGTPRRKLSRSRNRDRKLGR